jgi:hypothetical protein
LPADAVAAPARFERAIARFDAANAADPYRDTVDGVEWPKELLYAERMTAMLARFAPEAPEVVRLAARCQHIERWKIPRDDYPLDRIGYLQWRKRLNKFHGEVAGRLLREAGYDEGTIARVARLLMKEGLKSDPEAQTLEDVVDLVFLEHYLADFVAKHERYEADKFRDILAKTAKKMSPRGREAALTLVRLPPGLAALVGEAMQSR